MIVLANIKIYENKKELVMDTEMFVDKTDVLMRYTSVFTKLMERKRHEYDLNDLLTKEFYMIINFIDDNPSFETCQEFKNGILRHCKFHEIDGEIYVF